MLKAIIGFTYAVVVLGLFTYSVHLTILVVLYLQHKSDATPPRTNLTQSEVPTILVQIPMRNERYVVESILQAVTQLDWPCHKIHIQVLDDSDDDTYALAVSEVIKLQKLGHRISLIHRKHKDGYKAGALAVGLAYSDCEYIAIFDADFIPDPRFLQQTVPYFHNNPELAMVQTRWEYINGTDSYVTHCQAMALDAHFVIDHIARNRSQLMMNFNGTAGIWRRSAIEQAGGWHNDTLAEDLDLSYRVQLAGYKCLYLPTVTSPSQLPTNLNGFWQQQRRWAKGAAQSLRKLAGKIIQAPKLTIGKKIMALLHLSGYSSQLLFVLLILLSLPMTLLYPSPPSYIQILGPISFIPLIYYTLSQTALYPNGYKRMLYYPLLALLAIACSYNITLALMDGFLHWGGVFIRTPKYSNKGNKTSNYDETAETRPKSMIILVYALISIICAITLKVTHYILPSVIFIFAQILYHLTVHFEGKKMQEK